MSSISDRVGGVSLSQTSAKGIGLLARYCRHHPQVSLNILIAFYLVLLPSISVVFYRDVKLGNLMLTGDDRAKLGDFGLATTFESLLAESENGHR